MFILYQMKIDNTAPFDGKEDLVIQARFDDSGGFTIISPVAGRAAMQALRLGTEDASLYFHAGMIERALGNKAAARDYLARALTINADFDPLQARVARESLKSMPHE